MTTAKTLYEKIWDSHVVHETPGQPALIYIDRHLVHEGTSPQAFAGLRAEKRRAFGLHSQVQLPDATAGSSNSTIEALRSERRLAFSR